MAKKATKLQVVESSTIAPELETIFNELDRACDGLYALCNLTQLAGETHNGDDNFSAAHVIEITVDKVRAMLYDPESKELVTVKQFASRQGLVSDLNELSTVATAGLNLLQFSTSETHRDIANCFKPFVRDIERCAMQAAKMIK